jgi:hypothetical protein
MNIFRSILEKWACKHDWELIHKANFYENESLKYPHTAKVTYKCTKCGKFKKIKV